MAAAASARNSSCGCFDHWNTVKGSAVNEPVSCWTMDAYRRRRESAHHAPR